MSNNDEKNLLTRLISIIGLASSIFGICLFFLPIEVLGGVYEGRLMFPFQYANSSGIWYLISAILCWQTSNTKFRFASIFPLIALFLTKSGGAICIFIVVAIIYIIKWFKYEKHERKFNVAAITVIMIVAVFSIIFTVINKERVFQASQTFFERIVQINDGWSLLITSPLLGVGPDQWQFIYPYIQSAQYTASKIHCSYLQIALDGGFIGLFIFLGFVVFSVINLIKNKNWQMLICASVILVHSIIDFDLSFPFMMVLLIYFLDSKKLNFTFVANIVLSFACLIFCVFGIYFNTQLNSFVNLPQKYKQSKSFTIEFCS